jgi:hypothetical protein
VKKINHVISTICEAVVDPRLRDTLPPLDCNVLVCHDLADTISCCFLPRLLNPDKLVMKRFAMSYQPLLAYIENSFYYRVILSLLQYINLRRPADRVRMSNGLLYSEAQRQPGLDDQLNRWEALHLLASKGFNSLCSSDLVRKEHKALVHDLLTADVRSISQQVTIQWLLQSNAQKKALQPPNSSSYHLLPQSFVHALAMRALKPHEIYLLQSTAYNHSVIPLPAIFAAFQMYKQEVEGKVDEAFEKLVDFLLLNFPKDILTTTIDKLEEHWHLSSDYQLPVELKDTMKKRVTDHFTASFMTPQVSPFPFLHSPCSISFLVGFNRR